MAKRPIFIPGFSGFPYVNAVEVDFTWHPGFSRSQLRKPIQSLYEAAEESENISHILDVSDILETSTRSPLDIGRSLSAFRLPLRRPKGQRLTVECAYQGSKVFEKGGPYHDLYTVSSRHAKTDTRLRASGELIGFNFYGEDFPMAPKTAFYAWLYMTALCQRHQREPNFIKELSRFKAFTDISFNPRRSLNCQARAAALFLALSENGLIDESMLKQRDRYLACITGKPLPTLTAPIPQQLTLPLWEN